MSLNKDKSPLVCFFDSGIGGIAVMSECMRKIKNARFAYFADNENVPYGNRSEEEILHLASEKFKQISLLNPAVAVIACNTVTAVCIDYLRSQYSFPIVGIQPAVKPAAAAGGTCAVLATRATANSKAIKNLVEKLGRGRTKIYPCEQFAAYVENNVFTLSEEHIFSLLPAIKCDSVVLGCTHYIFAKKTVEKFYSAPVFDGVDGVCSRLKDLLAVYKNINGNAREAKFYGGDIQKNSEILKHFLCQW